MAGVRAIRIWPKNIEGTADPANYEEQTYISGSNMGSTQNENEMHSLPASPEHGLQGGPRDQGAQGEGGEETSNGDVRCAEAEVNVSTNGSSKSHTQDTLPAVVNKELQAWLFYDWSSSVYVHVCIAGFLPLLVQNISAANGGFPTICPNVNSNRSLVMQKFPAHNWTDVPVMFRVHQSLQTGAPCASSTNKLNPQCVEDWCRGLPATFSKCLHEDGKRPFIFGVSGKGEDGSFVPSALVTTSTALSSLGQIFLFLFLAPLADYGTLRKRFMTASTLIGGIITILMIIVRPQTYFLGPIFLVLSNMAFGVSQVVMYAYLPVLLDSLPDKLERPKICCPGGPLGVWSRLHDVQSDAEAGESSGDIDRSRIIARRQRSDEISNAGFSFGYFAGMTSLIACLPLVLMVTPQTTLNQPAKFMGYQLCMVLGGVWWIVFYWPTFRYLQTRPGPWPGATWCEVSCNSLKRFGAMVASVTKTRSAAQYLILWFIFSDGVHVVGSIAVLFGDAEVEWGCIPKPLGLWAMTVIGGMFAGIGSGIATRLQEFLQWQSKTMLILALCLITIIPSWSLIGILNWGYGFKQGWELLCAATLYGGCLGPIQGYSRGLFGLLIPKGQESAYYSIYQITDKGSSFIGPLIVAAITQAYGQIRPAFGFPLALLVIAIIGLLMFDIEKGIEEKYEMERNQTANPEEADDHAGPGGLLGVPGRRGILLASNALLEAEGGGRRMTPILPSEITSQPRTSHPPMLPAQVSAQASAASTELQGTPRNWDSQDVVCRNVSKLPLQAPVAVALGAADKPNAANAPVALGLGEG